MALKFVGQLVGLGAWISAALLRLNPTLVQAQSFPPQPPPTYRAVTPMYSPAPQYSAPAQYSAPSQTTAQYSASTQYPRYSPGC